MDDSRTRLVVTPTASGWAVSGDIDASTVDALVEPFRDLSRAESGRPLTIDVGEVSFIDSSGLRALINLAHDADEIGVRIVLQRASPAVARLLNLTGLEGLFGMTADEEPQARPGFDGVSSAARRSFPSELHSIPVVRDFVRRAASALHELTLADLELVASELATNAVRHGAGEPFDVAVETDTTSISPSVSVTVSSRLADADLATDPRLWRREKAQGLTGRGLAIVDAVSDDLHFAVAGDTVEVTSRLTLTTPGSNHA